MTPLEFLHLLYAGVTVGKAWVEFRFLKGGQKYWMPWPCSKHHPDAFTPDRAPKGKDVYFGVALRKDQTDGKAGNCKVTNLVWSDVDLADHPELCDGQTKESLKQAPAEELAEYKNALLAHCMNILAAHNLPLRAAVDSGHGVQLYLAREFGTTNDDTERYNKALALLLGGDTKSTDIARILRVPGTQNLKNPERPLPVQVVWADEAATVTDEALAALPLADKDKPKPKPSKAPAPSSKPASGEGAQRKYALAALNDETAAVLNAPEGGRNDQLNKSAFAIGQLVGAGVLSEGEAVEALEAAALGAGLDAGEIGGTLRSGLSAGQAEPRDLSGIGSRQRVDVPRLDSSAADEATQQGGRAYMLPTFPKGTQEGTDEANAVILAANGLGARLRYSMGLGWFAYSEKEGRWRADGELIHSSLIAGDVLRSVVGQYLADAIKQRADKEEINRISRWASQVCNVGAVARALQAAAGKPEFLTPAESWDAAPHLLNCLNGVLDLKAGKLLPHDASYLMTWQAGAAYDPSAQHPYVDQMLELLKADGRHDFLQRSAGSCLYGEAPNETLTVLQGPGGAGKGTLVTALVAALGDYATTIDVELLLDQRGSGNGTGPKPELMKLRKKRLAVAGEPEKGRRFNAGKVKGMTGNDPITARAMRSDIMVEFKPVFKLWLHTNYPVSTAHDDTGMQRRIKVVPFNAKPTGGANPHYKTTLENDPQARSATLNWAAEGCRAWLASGFDLGESETITQATQGYISDQNPYEKFAVARLVFGAGLELASGALTAAFKDWCEENKASYGVKTADLYAYLHQLGCTPARGGGGARKWRGVALSDSSDTSDSTFPVNTREDSFTRANLESGVTGVTSVTSEPLAPASGELN